MADFSNEESKLLNLRLGRVIKRYINGISEIVFLIPGIDFGLKMSLNLCYRLYDLS